MRRLSPAAVALAAYAAFLTVVLLNPSAAVPSASVSWIAEAAEGLGAPGWALSGARVEFVLNALILMPIPLLGSLVWPRLTWRDWTAYGFVIASAVELAQGVLLPDRSASFVDVVANTLGACGGALAAVALGRLRGR